MSSVVLTYGLSLLYRHASTSVGLSNPLGTCPSVLRRIRQPSTNRDLDCLQDDVDSRAFGWSFVRDMGYS